jgi:hypothetical protein
MCATPNWTTRTHDCDYAYSRLGQPQRELRVLRGQAYFQVGRTDIRVGDYRSWTTLSIASSASKIIRAVATQSHTQSTDQGTIAFLSSPCPTNMGLVKLAILGAGAYYIVKKVKGYVNNL